jgi:hypothetical protein
MDLGNSGGFTGKFISLKKAGSELFFVDDTGDTTVHLGLSSGNFALCHDTNGAGQDIIKDCNPGPGSDYMEYYPSEVGIETGDVVVSGVSTVTTTQGDTIVKITKSTNAYQSNIIGIISNIADGSDFNLIGRNLKPQDNPQPVALAGRVNVKVTTENGEIQPGDFLTSSATVPGAAMKATKAGPVIGQALASYTGPGVGRVMVFVKATNYNGASIAAAMPGLQFNYSDELATSQNSQQILEYLVVQLATLNPANLSQINTDVVIAGGEVISPNLTGKMLRIDSITSATAEGGLAVASTTMFNGGLSVDSISSLTGLTAFQDDVEFFGTPYFTTDTAGFAMVQTGAQTVDVTFGREYLAQPIVSASISFEQDADLEGADEETRQALQAAAVVQAQAFLSDGVSYAVTNKSKYGFTIVLNKPAPSDVKFSWIALAVRNAQTFMSLDTGAQNPDNGFVAGLSDGSGSGSGDSGSGDVLPPTPPADDNSNPPVTSLTTPPADDSSGTTLPTTPPADDGSNPPATPPTQP